MFILTLQWDAKADYSLDSLIEIEDALISGLSANDEVDGHDIGSGQANIFIETPDPHRAFDDAMRVLKEYPSGTGVRAAFRAPQDESYSILWPKGLRLFSVT